MSTPYQNTSDTPFTYVPSSPTSSQLATPDPSHAAGSSSATVAPAPPPQPQVRQAEETRKDKSLAEFLLMLDDYEPLVGSLGTWMV